MNTGSVEVLISQVAGRPGLAAGFVDQDGSNTPFTSDERDRVHISIEQIRLTIAAREDVAPEQLDYISRKLDEMDAASERLGRKDWMNLALGTLTSILIGAALDPAAAKALFATASAALSWLFNGGLKLLGT